jgi:hypothetical protein
VLRAAALQYEAELQFGSLNQLLHPLIDHIDGLSDEHRHALRVILGLDTGVMPSQLIAGAATLALLMAADTAEGIGLLLIVDDVQWLDLASSMALIYAMRRLEQADDRMAVAVPSDADDAFVRSGFRVLDLVPLDDASSEELLVATFPALSANVRRRLRTDAQGNPLALLELPTAFETTGSTPRFPEVLPLTHRPQAMFADRLDNLPEKTRRTLLLVLLAGAGNHVTLEDCVPTPEDHRNLAAAERARILHRNPRTDRLESRYPLIRSALVQLSTSEERRAAHRYSPMLSHVRRNAGPGISVRPPSSLTRRWRGCWKQCHCRCCAPATPTVRGQSRPCCVRPSSAQQPPTGPGGPQGPPTWDPPSPATSPRCTNCY